MKKFIIVLIPVLTIVGSIYFLSKKSQTKLNQDVTCAMEGESLGSCVGCKVSCCDGLTALNHSKIDGKCTNFTPDGFAVPCSNCGNGVCDFDNGEDDCNCLQDCKGVEKPQKHCGNGKCESQYKETNNSCVEDCPVPVFGSRNLYEREDLQNYYEQFRQKCGSDKCCLDSFEKAKLERSEIFENNEGDMNMSGDCPTGHQLTMNKCVTSYVWCTKNSF
jgi:hypothetical protein